MFHLASYRLTQPSPPSSMQIPSTCPRLVSTQILSLGNPVTVKSLRRSHPSCPTSTDSSLPCETSSPCQWMINLTTQQLPTFTSARPQNRKRKLHSFGRRMPC